MLGVARVAPDDDFFQLGGHSLLAGQVAARLRRRFGVGAAMRLVFRHPRLADLAAAVDRMSDQAPAGTLPAAPAGPSRRRGPAGPWATRSGTATSWPNCCANWGGP
nr:hypothetical protein GCM10020093_034280 [Planobispora longispora]